MTVACVAATISLMSMNREEAKDILSAYRASGEDASDPQFQEALKLAIQDPEMARWFEQEQAWDLQISKKLRELPVSPDLRDHLLVSLNMSDRPSIKSPKKRVLTLGGGFGGVCAALSPEKLFATRRARGEVELCLVSRDNFFLFTTMLHRSLSAISTTARTRVGIVTTATNGLRRSRRIRLILRK